MDDDVAADRWASPLPVVIDSSSGREVDFTVYGTCMRSGTSTARVISLAAHAAAAAAAVAAVSQEPRAKPEPSIRCDIMAWSCVGIVLLGSVAFQWQTPANPMILLAIYVLRFSICILVGFALLAHYPLAFVVTACTSSAAALTVAFTNAVTQAWRHIDPNTSLFKWSSAVPIWAQVCVSLICLCVASSGARFRWKAIDWSTDINFVEHMALFYIGGTCWSTCLGMLFFLWRVVCALKSYREPVRPVTFCKMIVRAVFMSPALHLAALLAIPVVVLSAPFVGIMLWAIYVILRAGRVREAPSVSETEDDAPVVARAISTRSSISLASLRAKQQCSRLQAILMGVMLSLLSLVKAVALFFVFLFDVQLVKQQVKRGKTASCSAQLSRIAKPQESSGDLGEAFAKLLENIGLGSIAPAVASAMDGLGKVLAHAMEVKVDVAEALSLRCVAIRRLSSAVVVWAAVLIAVAVCSLDTLSIIEAGGDIAGARMAADEDMPLTTYLSKVALLAAVEAIALLALQLAITTGAAHARDVAGIFKSCQGFLVDSDNHKAWRTCPNDFHPQAEILANVAIVSAVLCALVLIIALNAGWLYGLPPSRWLVSTVLGRYLKLSDFVEVKAHQEVPSSGEEIQESLSMTPIKTYLSATPLSKPNSWFARSMLRPLAGLSVTFGLWSADTSRLYSVERRREWYEPSGNAGGAALVSHRCIYLATARAVSLGWYPVPGGVILAKCAQYLNEYVIFAIGHDDNTPPKPMVHYFYEANNQSVHMLNWGTMAIQTGILAAIELGLLDGKQDRQLFVLGTCVGLVLVLLCVRVLLSLVLQSMSFGLNHALMEKCHVLLSSGTIKAIAGERTIVERSGNPDFVRETLWQFDDIICSRHQSMLAKAASELLELQWARDGILTEEIKAELVAFTNRNPSNQRWVKKLVHSHPFVGHAALQLLFLLRDVADEELVAVIAPKEAKSVVRKKLRTELNPHAVWMSKWARRYAETAAIEEAKLRTAGKRVPEDEPEVRIRVTFAASTAGCAAVVAESRSGRQIGEAEKSTATMTIHGIVEAKPGSAGILGPWCCRVTDKDKNRLTMEVHGEACDGGHMETQGPTSMSLKTAIPLTHLNTAFALSGGDENREKETAAIAHVALQDLEEVTYDESCAICDLSYENSGHWCSCCSSRSRRLNHAMAYMNLTRSWCLQTLDMKWTPHYPNTQVNLDANVFQLGLDANVVKDLSDEGIHWMAKVEYDGPEFPDEPVSRPRGLLKALRWAVGVTPPAPSAPAPSLAQDRSRSNSFDVDSDPGKGDGKSGAVDTNHDDTMVTHIEDSGDYQDEFAVDDVVDDVVKLHSGMGFAASEKPVVPEFKREVPEFRRKADDANVAMLEEAIWNAHRLGLPQDSVKAAEKALQRALEVESEEKAGDQKEIDQRRRFENLLAVLKRGTADASALRYAVRAARDAGVPAEILLDVLQKSAETCDSEELLVAMELEAKELYDSLMRGSHPFAVQPDPSPEQ